MNATGGRVLIWAFATRVLHLAFGGGMAVALLLGLLVDDEHPLFAWHMVAGLFASGALVLRLLLGVLGPRHTRFADWPLGPAALMRHARSLAGRAAGPAFAGHNPFAAWVMLAMFATAMGLAVTGWMGGEDLHESLAWAMLLWVGLHLAGLAAHTVLHRENIALAMLDGKKRAPAEAALPGRGLVSGTVVAACMAAWAVVLVGGFDPAAGTLRLPGMQAPLRLGEGEHHFEGSSHHGGERHTHESHEQEED